MYNLIKKIIKTKIGKYPKNIDKCSIDPASNFTHLDKLKIGKWVHIGPRSFLSASGGIEIGDGTIISAYVTILSSGHDYQSTISVPYGGDDILKSVTIGKGVWIGYGALILPGISVGDGAIVGAGAVVTKSVPSGVIVGGNPAVEIGRRPNDNWKEMIANEKLLLRHKMIKNGKL